MSVINQMLVDLERRRASGEERNRIPDHVRALPGDGGTAQGKWSAIAVTIAVTALVAGIGWQMGWWLAKPNVPASVTTAPVAAAPAPAVVAEQDAVEMIARRMSFDLAFVPEISAAGDSAPVATASIVSRGTAETATVTTQAVKKSEPVKKSESVKKTEPVAAAPVVAPRVEIDKKVREPTPRQRADTEYVKGAVALHQGRAAEAQPAFEAALRFDPTYHAARQALVGVLLDARQQADAVQKLQEGLRISPAQFGFAMALARLQVEQGELDMAVQTLSRSLEYAGGNPDYFAFYAGLLQRQLKHAEAVEQFLRALQLRGNAGVWLLGLGVSLDALGRRSEALEAYRRAQATGNLPADLQAFADQRLR